MTRFRFLGAALLGVAASLAGCTKAPDLKALEAAGAHPVLRTDSFQSAASNGRVLVAGTTAGVLVTSSDGGQHWVRHRLDGAASVIALTACPDGHFVGLDFYKRLWQSDADGGRWASQPLDKAVNPLAVSCDSAGRLWVVGSNTTLMSSSDRGATWASRHLGGDAIYTTVQFTDERHGVILGEFGNVLTTEDAGATWVKQPKIPDDFYPYAALFTDAQHGVASGLAGVMLRTEDGGRTWVRQTNALGAALYTLFRQGDTLYGVGGPQVAVLRGDSWQRHELGPESPAVLTPLVAGAALDSGALLLAGAGGALHVITPRAHVALATELP